MKIALLTLVCEYASLFGAIYTILAIIERLQQTLIGKIVVFVLYDVYQCIIAFDYFSVHGC